VSYLVTQTEYLSLGGVPLSTPAWELENLQDLWSGPPTRGTDIVMPGADGQRSYPRKVDAWRLTLNLAIWGDVSWDGTATADPRAGLWAAIQHLRANAFDPVATARGTRLIEMTTADGGTVAATCTVERFAIGAALTPWAVRATADIVVPEGRWGTDIVTPFGAAP
jgi:hypothetical protein